MYFSAHKSFTY